jgi:hypothetical protein
MPLANYTTQVPAANSVAEIERMLVARKASAIAKQYSPVGELVALSFVVPTKNGNMSIRLPANIEAVQRVLERQAVRAVIDRQRAGRVAWRILRDWVRAQMAIIETEMVTMDEVFLPYMLHNGRTFYQIFNEGNLLTQGNGGQQ